MSLNELYYQEIKSNFSLSRKKRKWVVKSRERPQEKILSSAAVLH